MQLRAPVKGIFFDLGWTLIYPTSGDWMFSEFARKYFPKEAMASLSPQSRGAAAEYLNRNHLISTVEEEYSQFLEYYSILAKELPHLGLTRDDLKAVAQDKVYNLDNYGVFPDAIATLAALKGKYRLGVISDTWPSIIDVLKHFGLLSYFDCFTYSYELGVYKPDPRLYKDAIDKMGLPPGETVFVDDFSGNLEGARQAGIQPLLIRAKPQPEACGAMASIEKTQDILKILP